MLEGCRWAPEESVRLLASAGGVETSYFGHSSFVRIHVLSGL